MRRANLAERRLIVAAVSPRARRNHRKCETVRSLRDYISWLDVNHADLLRQVAPGVFEARFVSELCPGHSYWRYAIDRNTDRYRLLSEAQQRALSAEETSGLLRTSTFKGELVYQRIPGGSGEWDPLTALVLGTELSVGRAAAKETLSDLLEAGMLPHPQSADSPAFLLALKTTMKCGRCAYCKKQRKRKLMRAVAVEIAHSERVGGTTWWGTLTLNAEQHYQARCRAVAAIDDAKIVVDGQRIGFDDLSERDRFKALHAAELSEVQKFLKRLRKMSEDEARREGRPVKGTSLVRFVRAAEPHDGKRREERGIVDDGGDTVFGLPHFHVFLHEQNPMLPLRSADLEAQWGRKVVGQRLNRFGKSMPVYERVSHWRQVSSADRHRVAYLARYVVKYGLYRCSDFYGDPEQAVQRELSLFRWMKGEGSEIGELSGSEKVASVDKPVISPVGSEAVDDVQDDDEGRVFVGEETVPAYQPSSASGAIAVAPKVEHGMDYQSRQRAGFGTRDERMAATYRRSLKSCEGADDG